MNNIIPVFGSSDILLRIMGIDPVKRQSLISLISNISLTAVGFLSTMYFAHVLGAGTYGVYSLFLAYYGVSNLLIDGGFGGAAVKRISEGKEQNEYFSAFVVIKLITLTIIISGLILILNNFPDINNYNILFWLIIALTISAFYGISTGGLYATGKVGIFQTGDLLNGISKVIIQVLAVFLGFEAAGLMGGFVAGLLVGGIICFKYLDLHLAGFKIKHIKSLISFSMWIFLASAGAMVFSYADTIIIGYFMSTDDVGIYRIAFQFTTAATFVTMAMHTVLYPKISYWNANNMITKIEYSLSRAFTYSLILAIPVCIGGWILGDKMLYFFYGASFVAGASVLGILLIVQIVNVFMFLLSTSLNAVDKPKDTFKVTAIASTINIILDIILIPTIGIQGAAIATLVTMIVNSVLAYYALSKVIDVKIEKKQLINIIIATSAMGIFIAALNYLGILSNVIILLFAISLGGFLYLIILLKIDKGIHDELKEITVQLGLPWPGHL